MSINRRKDGGNIFDYFLVSGLCTRISPCLLNEEKDDTNDRASLTVAKFKPSLISRFPKNVSENCWKTSVQGTLLELCHPNGVSVSVEKSQCPPLFHSFLSTRDDGFRTYGHVLTYFEVLTNHKILHTVRQSAARRGFTILPKEVFAQKCICLISRYAYINTAEKILRMLYEIFVMEKKELKSSSLPVDNYIYNLLYEMPVPAVGTSIGLGWDCARPIIIQHPATSELPVLDLHLSALFVLLGGSANVLRLLTSAFLEHQILLVSKDCQNLMLVAEAITTLMFPFQMLHAYAPVLPYKLAHNFLDAPVPYIMGIPLGSSGEKLTRISSEFDQCFVDIDKALVDCPEDQPNFPNHIQLREELNSLYKKFTKNVARPVQIKEVFGESSTSEGISTSPSPLQRRNAQKRQLSGELNEPILNPTRDAEQEYHGVVRGQEIDDKEDMKNLHAVSSILPKPSIPELKSIATDDEEVRQQLFNIQVREKIFGTLVSLLSQYDKFVILPDIDESDVIGKRWFLTRETQQNFDKSSFLSDQPRRHLRFLAAFLETQAFASLVDSFILSQIDSSFKDSNLILFDERIKQAKSMPPEKNSQDASKLTPIDFLSRSGTIISTGQGAKNSIEKWIRTSENALKRRYKNLSGMYSSLRCLQLPETENKNMVFEPAIEDSFPNIRCPSLLQERLRDSEQQIDEASVVDVDETWRESQDTKRKISRQPSLSEFSPEMIAQTNWKFLEKLLKDVKAKTNKLVVRKMGQDAVALGHTESSIMGLEENTLIGSLCDLLERIWCHGLHSNQKKGKSALWSHLLRYEEDSVQIMHTPHKVEGSHIMVGLGNHTRSMTAVSSLVSGDVSHISPELERKFPDDARFYRRSSQPAHLTEGRYIMPVLTDIISNIKRIRQLHDVKTNVGKCRAWIRLSLEQKQLQIHLKKLLLNRPLLQMMYKRYSLLRCLEEREQFLYHLLSLNAVDFTCFTNSFTKASIQYRVWIFPKKHFSGPSQTSANVYVMISGELACTDRIAVPKNCIEFSFQHQNLGVLTTMLLGHDNSGLLPKWLVDFVIIRNEFTGQAYFLPCRRWLGQGIDDGSTQRLLLANTVSCGEDLNMFLHNMASGKIDTIVPTATRSMIDDLRDHAGQVVNAIIKHFHSPTQNLCAGALTPLLCKTDGLIPVLSQIFQHGLKSPGMFRKQLFPWDVIHAICGSLSGKSPILKPNQSVYKSTINSLSDFIRNASPQHTYQPSLREERPKPSSSQGFQQPSGRDDEGFLQDCLFKSDEAVKRLLQTHNLIASQHDNGLGKDDMFQLFVCFGLKEHHLSKWIKIISSVLCRGAHLYEKTAFLCDVKAVASLSSVLNNLSVYNVSFERILWRGLDNIPL